MSQNLTEPTYLFIDAEHLRQYYSEFARAWFGGEGEITFQIIKNEAHALRMFYYDSLDDRRKSNESETEFTSRVEARRGEHASVRSVKGAHVRLGTVTGEKKRRQKQVDILLAVDMMSHAARQNMRRAVLLTGDQDFKPVVDSLVLLGTFIEVWGDKKHTSTDLVNAADSHRLLTAVDYHHLSERDLQEKFPLPESTSIVYNDGFYEGQLWARGRLRETHFILSRVGDRWRIYAPKGSRTADVFTSPNEQRLKLFISLLYGDVDWQSAAD
jgi:uncharacterized LabA/DUF88 family protein